ncbi:hypothetical protein KY359_01255 [Candidatus Woesearchaeota archaeon]|nr:hypothetical protein [Candidatus Woesearchaeota archaeon]
MKKLMTILILILAMCIAGCYKEAPLTEEKPPQVQQETPPEQRITLEPEPTSNVSPEEAPIESEKQLATSGAVDIKEVKPTLLSGIICNFGQDGPEKFSFSMTNTEDKKWMFSALSYSDREKMDSPVVVLNALQVTNGQLIESCGRKSLSPGESVVCDFDLSAKSNTLVKKSLRIGETAMGNVNENTLSLRTTAHAAEVMFLCETVVPQ